jgi:hypothetical protein
MFCLKSLFSSTCRFTESEKTENRLSERDWITFGFFNSVVLANLL